MLISIAMATYNGDLYLREQLSSLASQTFLPAELVISDDGSSDGTLDIIREFAAIAPFPVRLIEKDKKLGFADNFLYAASHCSYDLIAFCDQDDVWLPHKLELERERIIEDDSLLVLHSHVLTDAQLQPLGELTQGITKDAVLEPFTSKPDRTVWGNTMLFRRELVDLVPYKNRPQTPEEQTRLLAHDKWIYLLAMGLGRISEVREPLALYRQHNANVYGFQKAGCLKMLWLRIHISMWRFHEQMLFNHRLKNFFLDISESVDFPFKRNAEKAADYYNKRESELRERLDIYYGKSFGGRFKAWKLLYGGGSSARLTSRFKDFIVGVSGFHFLLKQSG